MRSYLKKHRKLYGAVGGVISLVVAVVYLKAIPEEASSVSGFQSVVLVYGHSVCWILLGGASVLWATQKNKRSGALAYTALAVYIIFICTLLLAK